MKFHFEILQRNQYSTTTFICLFQFDYGGWMPNTPISLQLPPPTKKGEANEETMLKTLPDVNTTVQGMATLWLLSQQSSDFVSLQTSKCFVQSKICYKYVYVLSRTLNRFFETN